MKPLSQSGGSYSRSGSHVSQKLMHCALVGVHGRIAQSESKSVEPEEGGATEDNDAMEE